MCPELSLSKGGLADGSSPARGKRSEARPRGLAAERCALSLSKGDLADGLPEARKVVGGDSGRRACRGRP